MKKWMTVLCPLLCVALLTSCSVFETDKSVMHLSNPNANETTKKVYAYICEMYENHIISGQQESTWVDGPDYEMQYLFDATGKLPAMRGLDFMDDDFDGVVERAKDWWAKGGLVTICWHCGSDFTGNYDDSKNGEIINWDAVLTKGTPENEAFIENMDHAGQALLELQEAGVTVLWRPFHEFDGQWFWWGKGGPENFKKLWILMYDHFTNDLGLNNLIWVLGYSHNGEDVGDWYPGDEYCDISGADSYEVAENGAEKSLYRKTRRVTHKTKPLWLHECGLIPTEEQLEKTPWGSFMTWHTEYLIDTNTKEQLSQLYNSEYVITLDELPSFA